jgi:ligand-binding SRPBCC domain-containing protein
MSKVYTLKTKQSLAIDIKAAWTFFSSPKNLKDITPDHMGFVIKGNPNDIKEMYAGQIINYTVKPLLGIPLSWTTEISHVKDLEYFVDNQRFGPYAMWHHKHFFKAVEGGVEMIDIVHYKLPLGFLGDIANALFVKRQLKTIFDYRYNKLNQLFGNLDKNANSQTIIE